MNLAVRYGIALLHDRTARMATMGEALDLAFQYHQAGNLRQAEQIYQQILQVDPSQADAWHLLGAIAYQNRDFETAVLQMQHAIALNATEALYHCNLGLAFTGLGKLEEANAALRRALELNPGSASAHFNLGNVLLAQNQPDEAAARFLEVLRLSPGMTAALNNLATVYLRQDRLEDALRCLREGLAREPGNADLHYNLGNALIRQGQWKAAQESLREALRLRADFADAHVSLGRVLLRDRLAHEALNHCWAALRLRPEKAEGHRLIGAVLTSLRRYKEAASFLQTALRHEPDNAEALCNLGIALRELGFLDEAVAHGREAVRLLPDLLEGHNQLGISLVHQGLLDEAVACFSRAIALDADFADGHFNRAIARLRMGDYRQGWSEYDWRWRRLDLKERALPQPLWHGEPLAGRTIVLHAEQGFGDTFQFIRYAPLVREQGRVILYAPPALVAVLRSCPGLDQIVAEGSPLPDADFHAPLMSLPHLFQTTLETIPRHVPYLAAEPALRETWRSRLPAIRGLRVGIAWQGDPKHPQDRFRSFPLAQFAILARIPGVELISLQRGPGIDQLEHCPFPILDPCREWPSCASSFTDSAALMSCVDVVITCDTAVAHLAGALGVRTWIAIGSSPDWRWLMEGETSPWYPSVRLFRQKGLGNWEPVLQQMARELRKRVTTNGTSTPSLVFSGA